MQAKFAGGPAALNHGAGDDGHLVDFVSVAAAAQIVDGSCQTLQDGAVSLAGTAHSAVVWKCVLYLCLNRW